jgi:AraC-like DNA-binding protein
MLPSGGVQLIFALHEAPFICLPSISSDAPIVWSRSIVHGPQWHHFVCGPKPIGAVAGVSFRAGAAGAVLGMPMTELEDRHVSIEALWGARGHSLRERLLAADGPSEVFRVLEHELIARVRGPLLIHPAVAHALAASSRNCWPPTRVADIQRQTGYSPKHFVGLFRSAVGLTPKHFYRVKRFTAVLRQLAGPSAANLAAIAVSAGYADQSHLTREFKDFAGIPPTQYRPSGPDSVFHHQVKNIQDTSRGALDNAWRSANGDGHDQRP